MHAKSTRFDRLGNVGKKFGGSVRSIVWEEESKGLVKLPTRSNLSLDDLGPHPHLPSLNRGDRND